MAFWNLAFLYVNRQYPLLALAYIVIALYECCLVIISNMGAVELLLSNAGTVAVAATGLVTLPLATTLFHAENPMLMHSHPQSLVYLLGVAIYNLYFHPLAKYPGPFLARISPVSYSLSTFIIVRCEGGWR